jgi:hypothetical protein
MRASRTLIIPEADTVDDVEGNNAIGAMASQLQSGGVCDAGMHETAQLRNLGDPEYSQKGKDTQSTGVYFEDTQEVRLRHSTEEAE